MATKIRHVPSRAAMVMPEIGFAEEPIWPQMREDTRRGDGAGPDIEHEAGAELTRTHVADQLHRREPEWLREARPHELARGGEHQVREAAAGEQITGDARADDVAHAQELRRDLRGDGRAGIEGERLPGHVGP